jgi:hypothetical protein
MDTKTANACRLAELHPAFAARVGKLLAYMESQGYPLLITQGLRSWQAQDALYAQGRTAPGKIVTKAKGGSSHHNFGLGVDLCPAVVAPASPKPALSGAEGAGPVSGMEEPAPALPAMPTKLDWNVEHPGWKKLLANAPAFGLAEGARWRSFPDTPHFYPVEIPAGTAKLRALYAVGGMAAVWKWFDGLAAGVAPAPPKPALSEAEGAGPASATDVAAGPTHPAASQPAAQESRATNPAGVVESDESWQASEALLRNRSL